MSDQFGFSEGVKTLSSSLNSSREASKELTKSIEGIQQDGAAVAQQKARERKREQRENEFRKQQAIFRALDEYKRRKLLTDQEVELKKQFIKQYGSKEWESVLRIKNEIEALEKKNSEEFQHDLQAVRRVQMYCFAAAAVIAWYLTWGIK